MAIQKQSSAPTSINGRPRADAFLNVSIIDKDKVAHSLRNGGIPLFNTNVLERSIINKALKDGDKFTVTITGTVRMNVDTSTMEDVAL